MAERCDYSDLPSDQCDHCINGTKGGTTIAGDAGLTRFGSGSTHPDAMRVRTPEVRVRRTGGFIGGQSRPFELQYGSRCGVCGNWMIAGITACYIEGVVSHAHEDECV